MSTILHADNLVVSYSNRVVVGPLSLHIARGETIALVGNNGGGKTTLLRALAGVQSLTRGRVDCRAHCLSFMPDQAPAESALTVRELLHEWAALRARSGENIERYFTALDLHGVASRACAHLSLGFRQRVALAMSLIPQPDLLLLDEPANGLDPHHQLTLQQLLREHDLTLVVVTHRLADWQAHCSRVWALHDGELVFDGKPDDFVASRASVHHG